MSISKKLLAAAGAVVLGTGLALSTSLTAHAISLPCQAAFPTCASYDAPLHGGMDLDALNWGINPQTGTSYNDEVAVWAEPTAGRAADFVLVPVSSSAIGWTAANKGFLIEFAPKSVLSGFCVSTITDSDGAFARLRPCAQNAPTVANPTFSVNPWQTFTEVPQGDGFFQFEAVYESVPKFLNVKGFGGSGTPVVSYHSTGNAENQIWEANG